MSKIPFFPTLMSVGFRLCVTTPNDEPAAGRNSGSFLRVAVQIQKKAADFTLPPVRKAVRSKSGWFERSTPSVVDPNVD